MHRFNTIVFDNDDTLVKSWEINRIITEEISVKMGLPAPPAGAYKAHYGRVWDEFTMQHWGITNEEFYAKFNAMGFKRPPYPAINGAVKVLKTLYAKYNLGILTSRDRDSVFHLLETSGIPLGAFRFIITRDECPVHKPDPAVFDIVKKHVKDNKKILYVGDSWHSDWPAARDAGIDFVAVTTGISSFEDFADAGVPERNILTDVTKLPEWLEMYG